MRTPPASRARPRRNTNRFAIAAAAVLLAAALGSPRAFAGKVVGPGDCTSCHDHDTHTKAWQNHAHFRSLDVFEGKKAKEFLTKLGIKDPYSDFCTGCHATVVDGEPNYGVSCESCHGGASDFLKPHQKKGSYEQAITLGMLRTKDLAVRAKNCVGCHIVSNKKILDVGHPSGANFDFIEGCKKVQHWTENASTDQLLAAWKTAVASVGGIVASAPASTPAPPPSAPAARPATPAPSTATPTPLPPAAAPPKPEETRAPVAATPKPAGGVLPPDESWPASMPALDSVASLQARLILVLNRLLADTGGVKAEGIAPEPPSSSAAGPEARLIDLQRRVLSLQRKLLSASGK